MFNYIGLVLAYFCKKDTDPSAQERTTHPQRVGLTNYNLQRLYKTARKAFGQRSYHIGLEQKRDWNEEAC